MAVIGKITKKGTESEGFLRDTAENRQGNNGINSFFNFNFNQY